jgi:hypothetical protein
MPGLAYIFDTVCECPQLVDVAGPHDRCLAEVQREDVVNGIDSTKIISKIPTPSSQSTSGQKTSSLPQ